MANSSKKGLGLTQGNKNTHIFTEFEQMNKEATQLQVLEAIKNIEVNVGDIIIGDITVESNDTGTHTRLDTINTTITNKHLNGETDSVSITNVITTTQVINATDYDLDLAGPTLYADSSPAFIEDPQGNNGWYYQSVNTASSSNVYYYGNNAGYVQSDIIYNKVECIFAVVDLNFIGTISNNLPILVIGTKPTGSGDHIPGFAHSVQTYSIPSSEVLVLNEKILLYADIGTYTSYSLPDILYPGIRRIKCELSSSNGTDYTALPIAYLSVNTQTLSQSVRYTLHNAGLAFLNGTEDTISNWNFVNSKARLAESNLGKLSFKFRDETDKSNLKVYDKTLLDCQGITDVAELNYLRVKETKNPGGTFGNWLNDATIVNGSSSPTFDCTTLGRDSFLSYKDDNVANTSSVAIFTEDGSIIGVLNPKPDPSNTYRFAYTQINLVPFTSIVLQNWSGTNLTGIVACVYSG